MRCLRRPASGAVARMGGDEGGDGGQLWRECAAPGATRLGPGPKGTHKKFAVLNTVLIFGLERRAEHKCLKSLARSEGFEPPTPRFEVWSLALSRFICGTSPEGAPRARRDITLAPLHN